jgi:hypothetical protein
LRAVHPGYLRARGLRRHQIPRPTIVQPTIQPIKSGHPFFACCAWARPFVKAAAARQSAETQASNRPKLN